MIAPRTLLAAWQLKPKKQFGQNFLNDPATAEAIVRQAAIESDEVVVEIGAGLGALTIPLARVAGRVLAIEKDRQIAPLLKTELLANRVNNVTVIEDDILKVDWRAVVDETSKGLVVMGNLPYNISSPVLVRLVQNRARIDRAVLMFQQEFARRIMAPPGGKSYGRLSVLLGYCATVKSVMVLKAHRFYPQPKIDSEVVAIQFKPPVLLADDEQCLVKVVKAAFSRRRKTLRNSLSGNILNLNTSQTERYLNDAGIDPRRRAETLTVAEFVRLSNVIGAAQTKTA